MSRSFADAKVKSNYRDGKAVGSLVCTRIGDFELPHWPSRIRDVREEPAVGLVIVEDDKGSKHFLGPEHAIKESRVGGSMGGKDPRAHGKIRYIVRAFGKWAKGSQRVCVARIRSEHPEVAKGRDVNALCAWLKDQWAGSTKWRGRKRDPKQRAEDMAIRRRAGATAYARFTHGMPFLDDSALDALVEDVRQLTGIEPMDVVREVRGQIDDLRDENDAIFSALWEAEVQNSTEAIVAVENELSQSVKHGAAERYQGLVETWLALHGDPTPVDDDPGSIVDAAQRIADGRGPMTARSQVDRRILEAHALPEEQEPLAEAWNPLADLTAPAPRARVLTEAAAERGALDEDPAPTSQSHDKLYRRAVALMREHDLMAPARDNALRGASINELGAIVDRLEESMRTGLCGHRYSARHEACPECEMPQLHEAAVEQSIAQLVGWLAMAQERWQEHAEALIGEHGYSLAGESTPGTLVTLRHATLPTVFVALGEDGAPDAVELEVEDIGEGVRDWARNRGAAKGAGIVRVSGYRTKSGKKVRSHFRGKVGGKVVKGATRDEVLRKMQSAKSKSSRKAATASIPKRIAQDDARQTRERFSRNATQPSRGTLPKSLARLGTSGYFRVNEGRDFVAIAPARAGMPGAQTKEDAWATAKAKARRTGLAVRLEGLGESRELLAGSTGGGKTAARSERERARQASGRRRRVREAEVLERKPPTVRAHVRELPDGRVVAVDRHERGVPGRSRDEMRMRSEAVAKGNRTRAELRREREEAHRVAREEVERKVAQMNDEAVEDEEEPTEPTEEPAADAPADAPGDDPQATVAEALAILDEARKTAVPPGYVRDKNGRLRRLKPKKLSTKPHSGKVGWQTGHSHGKGGAPKLPKPSKGFGSYSAGRGPNVKGEITVRRNLKTGSYEKFDVSGKSPRLIGRGGPNRKRAKLYSRALRRQRRLGRPLRNRE